MKTEHLIEFCKEHLAHNQTSSQERLVAYANQELNLYSRKARRYTQNLEVNLAMSNPNAKAMNDIVRFCLWYYASYVSRPVIDSCTYQSFYNLVAPELFERKITIPAHQDKPPETPDHFPGGYDSWQQTHFEVSSFFQKCLSEKHKGFIKKLQDIHGRHTSALSNEAEAWTMEFEQKYKDQDWEKLDWHETITNFCKEKNEQS